MSQVSTEGALSYSSFSRQYKDLVFDCWQLFSDLCYSWNKKNEQRGWQMTDLWLQSINFPSQCEWNNHFGLKVTPSVQPVVCVSVVYLLPGSGALVAPEAHSFWLGQPWHDDDFPAWSLVVPGQSNRGEQNYWSIQEFLVGFFSIRNWKCLSNNTLDKMTALVIFLNK